MTDATQPAFCCDEHEQMADDLALGQAFREAVEALPEGWRLIRLRWRRQGHWAALALDVAVEPREHSGRSARTAIGPTPTAALQALTKQLRGEK